LSFRQRFEKGVQAKRTAKVACIEGGRKKKNPPVGGKLSCEKKGNREGNKEGHKKKGKR